MVETVETDGVADYAVSAERSHPGADELVQVRHYVIDNELYAWLSGAVSVLVVASISSLRGQGLLLW